MGNAFLTTIATEATVVEQAVVAGLKAAVNYVDNVLTTDIEPELLTALEGALSTFGSTALSAFLSGLTPGATVTVPVAQAPAV